MTKIKTGNKTNAANTPQNLPTKQNSKISDIAAKSISTLFSSAIIALVGFVIGMVTSNYCQSYLERLSLSADLYEIPHNNFIFLLVSVAVSFTFLLLYTRIGIQYRDGEKQKDSLACLRLGGIYSCFITVYIITYAAICMEYPPVNILWTLGYALIVSSTAYCLIYRVAKRGEKQDTKRTTGRTYLTIIVFLLAFIMLASYSTNLGKLTAEKHTKYNCYDENGKTFVVLAKAKDSNSIYAVTEAVKQDNGIYKLCLGRKTLKDLSHTVISKKTFNRIVLE